LIRRTKRHGHVNLKRVIKTLSTMIATLLMGQEEKKIFIE
jgi:hypothetical protein